MDYDDDDDDGRCMYVVWNMKNSCVSKSVRTRLISVCDKLRMWYIC